jgi:uncharacterized membrane protein
MKNPIKYSIQTEIWPLLILVAAIGLSIWAYPQLPEKIISHWDFNGQPNGWSTKEFQSIFFPALLVAIYALFSFMPRLDPKGERYQDFADAYLMMRNSILFVLAIVFAATTFSNLGYPINIGGTVAGAIGFLMMFMGNYFGKLKRNWFVGIRTPWTLSSENVWNKTHRLGGRLFMIWGFCLIFAPWLPSTIAFIILIGGVTIVVAWVFVYSYLLYKKEKLEKK